MSKERKNPYEEDDRVAVDFKKLERQLRSPDRNPDLRQPINKHAHDDPTRTI